MAASVERRQTTVRSRGRSTRRMRSGAVAIRRRRCPTPNGTQGLTDAFQRRLRANTVHGFRQDWRMRKPVCRQRAPPRARAAEKRVARGSRGRPYSGSARNRRSALCRSRSPDRTSPRRRCRSRGSRAGESHRRCCVRTTRPTLRRVRDGRRLCMRKILPNFELTKRSRRAGSPGVKPMKNAACAPKVKCDGENARTSGPMALKFGVRAAAKAS